MQKQTTTTATEAATEAAARFRVVPAIDGGTRVIRAPMADSGVFPLRAMRDARNPRELMADLADSYEAFKAFTS